MSAGFLEGDGVLVGCRFEAGGLFESCPTFASGNAFALDSDCREGDGVRVGCRLMAWTRLEACHTFPSGIAYGGLVSNCLEGEGVLVGCRITAAGLLEGPEGCQTFPTGLAHALASGCRAGEDGRGDCRFTTGLAGLAGRLKILLLVLSHRACISAIFGAGCDDGRGGFPGTAIPANLPAAMACACA